MPLTPEAVKGIAFLARLGISDSDIPGYADNLSRIIAFVDQLNAAETGDVAPMAHPLDRAQRLRADAVTEVDQRSVYQQNASAIEAGLYTVPRVIE